MSDYQTPSEDLLNGIRHIAAYKLGFSERVASELGEQGILRSYLRDQLNSTLIQLGLEISHRESKGIFGRKYKITYLVSRRGTKLLEFTDLLRQGTSQCTLESVQAYKPGNWENDVKIGYQKCLDIRSQQKLVSDLIEQLSNASHTPEEFIGIIEATGDAENTIKLLALSHTWESTCAALSFAYSALGRCKEAKFILETLVSLYPDNADCHLALGNLFLGALINSNPPPEDSILSLRRTIETTGNAGVEFLESLKQSDPSLYGVLIDKKYEQRANDMSQRLSLITLESLDCSYDYGCKKAEEQFSEALKLSRNAKTTEQARSAMATLVMNIEMYRQQDYLSRL